MGLRCHTLPEAARLCGLPYRYVLIAANAGELRTFVPFGMRQKRYVRDDELRRWLREMEESNATA